MNDLVTEMHNFAESNSITVGEVFEEVVKVAYQNIIQQNDKVIDIGAHHGFHLFPMAKAVGKNGKVFAFEPLPDLYQALKTHINQNRLKNIKLYDLALGQKKDKSNFQYFKNFPAYSGLERRETPFSDAEGELETISVQQKRLDNIIRFSKISFIKLDIEGGELHALMGGTKLIKRSMPVIIFEGGSQSSARTYNYNKDDFFGFFEHFGYSIYTIAGSSFGRENWEKPGACWEFVALPQEKVALAEKFPDFCNHAMERLKAKNGG